jgi:hypothetical protein
LATADTSFVWSTSTRTHDVALHQLRDHETKGHLAMTNPLEYPFGTINTETAGRWLQLSPEEDQEVWMLNLMKYKPVADYGDADGPAISGREADDIYAPTAVLADLGAIVPLFGDVVRQVTADLTWERVGIVRYPSRASFFAMQSRDDFQKQYVHKKAGMEATIVMGCVPVSVADPAEAGSGPVVMRVRRFIEGADPGVDPDGVVPVAHFEVDGVILGDGRVWDGVRFDRVEAAALPLLADTEDVAEQIVVVVDPLIEDLIDSIVSAGPEP